MTSAMISPQSDPEEQLLAQAMELYQKAADLAGLSIHEGSRHEFETLIRLRVKEALDGHRVEASAVLFKFLAATLDYAASHDHDFMGEDGVDYAHQTVCPIHPFCSAQKKPDAG